MSRHHQRFKNDPRWKAVRRACLERDGFTCVTEGCGATTELQADHVIRVSDDPSLTFELDNLQTLCRPCHEDKEREYDSRQLLRVEWINPRYPELGMLIEKEIEYEGVPIL